jgi:signal transduction histidine kinase
VRGRRTRGREAELSDGLLAVPVPPQLRRGSAEPTDPARLGSDLLAAADTEADALADRLHDGALQALVVARYASDAAVRGGDPALARDAVQEALVALRHTVWLLRPRGGDDLPAALAELSKRRVSAGVPALDLDLDPTVAERLAPAARLAAYRFVQATTAETAAAAGSVRLRQEGAYADLSVAGAVLADPSGWAARAAALGGRLDPPGDSARLLLPFLDHDDEGDR